MLYYNPVKQGNLILSVDMIRIDFKLHTGNHVSGMTYPDYFCNWLDSQMWIDTDAYTSFGWFKYKYVFKCQCDVDVSFSLGIGFNGAVGVDDNRRGFLEFNPNKLLHGFTHMNIDFDNMDGSESDIVDNWEKFFRVYNKLCNLCVDMTVKRWDLAVDIPVSRQDVVLCKDRRNYMQFRVSDADYTEYLGKRSTGNYCKLYNKQLESGLDYPLTRLEMTLELGGYDSFMETYPKVYIQFDVSLDNVDLNLTDKVLCKLLLEKTLDERVKYLFQLGRTKQEKLKPIILTGGQSAVVVSEESYNSLLREVVYWHKPFMAQEAR